MSDHSLQSHKDSQYDRPNQPWDCGHACEGVRCVLGPTLRGGCQADYECAPVQKEDGNWFCNRSKSLGGKCEAGPSAGVCSRVVAECSPVASIRRKRGAFVLWCCTATLGLTLLTLGASWRDDVIKPGELSNQHAQIIESAKDARLRCAACHTAAEAGGLDEWAQLSIVGSSEHSSQSVRCLACHQEKIGDGSTALYAHGLAPDVMALRTESVCERLGKAVPPPNNNEVACSTCHREHQGSMHDLTATANGKCAACHQDSFRGFATAHPDFGDWPYQRRSRIAFDHAMHQGRYFPESKQAFSCRACHEVNGQGIVGTVGYAQACQSCHKPKIQQSLEEGVPLLVLPMLDLAKLKKELPDIPIGEWPEMANGDFDGAMPPLMRILLSTDPLVRSSLENFGDDFEFSDVDPDNIADLEAAADIGWGIKRLVHELATGGAQAMHERLQQALGRTLTEDESRTLSAQLSREAVNGLQKAWFPNLNQEVATPSARQTKSVKVAAQPSDTGGAHGMSSWRRDDATLTFSFHPSGHDSKFMTAWIGAVATSPRRKTSEVVHSAYQQLASHTSAGLCVTCHSVDEDAEQNLAVNWRGRAAETEVKGFTRFSHDPHVILPELRDCSACHTVNSEVTTSASYQQTDPAAFQSGFQPLTRQACAACHAPKLAGDQCTTCHNYHVGAGVPGLNQFELTGALRQALSSERSAQ